METLLRWSNQQLRKWRRRENIRAVAPPPASWLNDQTNRDGFWIQIFLNFRVSARFSSCPASLSGSYIGSRVTVSDCSQLQSVASAARAAASPCQLLAQKLLIHFASICWVHQVASLNAFDHHTMKSSASSRCWPLVYLAVAHLLCVQIAAKPFFHFRSRQSGNNLRPFLHLLEWTKTDLVGVENRFVLEIRFDMCARVQSVCAGTQVGQSFRRQFPSI